jgi:hypothetical protein
MLSNVYVLVAVYAPISPETSGRWARIDVYYARYLDFWILRGSIVIFLAEQGVEEIV